VESFLRGGALDQLLAGCSSITGLADRGFHSAELLGWFEGRERWSYVMRLRGDAEIHGTWQRLWAARCAGCGCPAATAADSGMCSSGVMARPVGIKASEPWYLGQQPGSFTRSGRL